MTISIYNNVKETVSHNIGPLVWLLLYPLFVFIVLPIIMPESLKSELPTRTMPIAWRELSIIVSAWVVPLFVFWKPVSLSKVKPISWQQIAIWGAVPVAVYFFMVVSGYSPLLTKNWYAVGFFSLYFFIIGWELMLIWYYAGSIWRSFKELFVCS